MQKLALLSVVLLSVGTAFVFGFQSNQPATSTRVGDQHDTVDLFARLDGQWRGAAWMLLPNGEKHSLTQTERVGPLLDGAVRIIEGTGYEPDGTVSFNALGIISFDTGTGEFSMRSYAMGHIGDFQITPEEDGFSWKIPAGPSLIRYRAIVDETTWHETGDRIIDGQDPVRIFEMTLTRLGDSTWPSGHPVPRE